MEGREYREYLGSRDCLWKIQLRPATERAEGVRLQSTSGEGNGGDPCPQSSGSGAGARTSPFLMRKQVKIPLSAPTTTRIHFFLSAAIRPRLLPVTQVTCRSRAVVSASVPPRLACRLNDPLQAVTQSPPRQGVFILLEQKDGALRSRGSAAGARPGGGPCGRAESRSSPSGLRARTAGSICGPRPSTRCLEHKGVATSSLQAPLKLLSCKLNTFPRGFVRSCLKGPPPVYRLQLHEIKPAITRNLGQTSRDSGMEGWRRRRGRAPHWEKP